MLIKVIVYGVALLNWIRSKRITYFLLLWLIQLALEVIVHIKNNRGSVIHELLNNLGLPSRTITEFIINFMSL